MGAFDLTNLIKNFEVSLRTSLYQSSCLVPKKMWADKRKILYIVFMFNCNNSPSLSDFLFLFLKHLKQHEKLKLKISALTYFLAPKRKIKKETARSWDPSLKTKSKYNFTQSSHLINQTPPNFHFLPIFTTVLPKN